MLRIVVQIAYDLDTDIIVPCCEKRNRLKDAVRPRAP
jgi:hypothetical protein